MKTALLCLALTGLPMSTFAATPAALPGKPTFLILGTFHFRGSGSDLMGNSLPDVATPRRQKEIEAVAQALARFKPTRVAIEYPVADAKILDAYAAYHAGTRELGTGESEQVGFRVAHAMGHARVWPVDHKLDMDFPAIMAAMEKGGQQALFQQGMAMGKAFVDGTQKKIDESVGAAFRFMNDPAALDAGHGAYLLMAQVGTSVDPVGARVVADWYARNLYIYGNLSRLVESPNERVLLVIGAGHAKLLRDYLSGSPNCVLEDVRQYLP